MPTNHRMRNTDHISKLAKDNRFRKASSVWEENARLHDRRENQLILDHVQSGGGGDTLRIPDREEKWVGKSIDNERDSPHDFTVRTDKLFLRLRILRDDFSPIEGADYELTVTGIADPFTGQTDGDGMIQHEVKRDSVRGRLVVRVQSEDSEPGGGESGGDESGGEESGGLAGAVPVSFDLHIGALDPVRERAPDRRCISGVQQRLNNLCINSGPVDGILGPNTRAAIRSFQELYELPIPENRKGFPDQEQTQTKLKEVHDDPGTPPAPSGSSSPASPGSAPSGSGGGGGQTGSTESGTGDTSSSADSTSSGSGSSSSSGSGGGSGQTGPGSSSSTSDTAPSE